MLSHKKNVFTIKPTQWSESYPNRRVYVMHLIKFTFFTIITIIGSVIATLFFVYGLQVQTVNGSSMETTLFSGDQILVNKLPASLALLTDKPFIPKRLDIVVIKRSNRGEIELLVKRVIGLPNERIVIDNQGEVLVYPDGSDQPLRDYDDALNLEPTFSDLPLDIRLGSNEVFVLGDNRVQSGSVDSRMLGPIALHHIVGYELVRIWPFQRFGPV